MAQNKTFIFNTVKEAKVDYVLNNKQKFNLTRD